MTSYRLVWHPGELGLEFKVLNGDAFLEPAQWAVAQMVSASGTPVHVAPLIEYIQMESGGGSSGSVAVPWHTVARWTSRQLAGLGLPLPYDLGLKVGREGTVDQVDFKLRYTFVRLNGQIIAGVRRTGAMLEIGSRQYLLLSPLYDVVTAIDEWQNLPREDGEPMAARLGRLEAAFALLGKDAANLRTDEYLRSITIVAAQAVTLRPFLNAAGQPDFDPIPAKPRFNHLDEAVGYTEALPKARVESFAGRFRKERKPSGQYALGGGFFLVLPPEVQVVLAVMKRFQGASPAERQAFIREPQIHLKEALGGQPEEGLVDSLFWESEEYSSRVREIGIRQPRVIAFLGRASQPWLPPDTGGLRIDDELLHLTRDEAGELESLATQARNEGAEYLEYNGRRIPLNDDSMAAIESLATGLGISRKEGAAIQAETSEEKLPTALITLIVKDNIDDVSFEAASRARNLKTGDLPECLASPLYTHQRTGLTWLQQSYSDGQRGVLLADDMGLGKTLQVLAFLSWKREVEPHDRKPFLVVAPTGLIRNWIKENETHLDGAGLGDPLEITGDGLRRLRLEDSFRGKETIGGAPVLDVERLAQAEWALTTYETLRDYQHSFGKVEWGVIVLDEAQKVKNPASIASDAVKAMKADFSIAITGTPVENHVADLWSIVDSVYPARLGSLKAFIRRTEEDPGQLERLSKELVNTDPPCLILRRMKEDHLRGLPGITRHVDDCRIPMPREQAEAYTRAVEKAGRMSGKGFMMTVLQELRSTSVHPDPEGYEEDGLLIRASAKMEFLFRTLDGIKAKSEKALIFIESITMQGILAGLIQRRYSLNHIPQILNGSVPGGRRTAMVDAFQKSEDPFDVMILSPKAGGVGITLTNANHVFHLMRWWNPAVEDQATDRVYRIGQKKEVHVYLPSAVHPEYGDYSFDLKLNQLLESKRALSRNILTPTDDGREDLDQLFQDTVMRGK